MRDFNDYLMESYELREKLVADKFRPRYHFVPPEGRWNDINGAIFWNGRYHLGYLQKIPNASGPIDFSSWQHISSRDLLHWRYHQASLREPLEGHKGDYFNSGDVMEGMPVPTIITNMPRRGICIYQSHDPNLDHWVPLPQNPVIPLDPAPEGQPTRSYSQLPECVIFDPSGWKEGDVYYALIGNKNHRPGYQGDSTSLFKSTNLRDWQYLGPFYKSDRKWTEEIEDCACSNFFPFGDKHMLLMHTHRPYGKAQYYIGRYQDEQFHPEIHGQLTHLGSLVAGPETLVDDRGRRLFWGWIREARGDDWVTHGWNGIMTLPWHFTPAGDNTLRIDPVAELRALRYDERRHPDVTLSPGRRAHPPRLPVRLHGNQAHHPPQPRHPLRPQAPLLTRRPGRNRRHLRHPAPALHRRLRPLQPRPKPHLRPQRPRHHHRRPPANRPLPPPAQRTPPHRPLRRPLRHRNLRQLRICIVQRVYPTRHDSTHVKLFTHDHPIHVKNLTKYQMDATNPW